MNAYKRVQKESKRKREDDELTTEVIMQTVEFTLKSVALSLYELYGFHNTRGGRVLQDALDRVDEYTKKYGSAFVDTAMTKMLSDYGITITLNGK